MSQSKMQTQKISRHLLRIAVACLLILITPLSSSLNATCDCGKGSLELVFVFDATSSMWPVIGTLKAQAKRIVGMLDTRLEKLRVGAIAFRTPTDRQMPTPEMLQLTDKHAALNVWLSDIHASGGGEEAVSDALKMAIDKIDWTKDARKVIVLIGDEGPFVFSGETLSSIKKNKEPMAKELIALAEKAATKKIVINTITASATAWRYYMNYLLNTTNKDAPKNLIKLYGSEDKLQSSFRLPIFEKLSELSKGRSIGTDDMNVMLRWLLTFGLGSVEISEITSELPQDISNRARSETANNRVKIARLVYSDSHPTPRNATPMIRHLASLLAIDLDEKMSLIDSLDASANNKTDYALIYLSGHDALELTPEVAESLRRYVARGGVVWLDACCGADAFKSSVPNFLADVFPGRHLVRIPQGDMLFRAGHVIDKIRVATTHRANTFHSKEPHIERLRYKKGELLYTPRSIGSGWSHKKGAMMCLVHDDDALAVSENILLYVLGR